MPTYISVYKCGSHQEAAALERKESEKKKHTRSDKDLIVVAPVWRSLYVL